MDTFYSCYWSTRSWHCSRKYCRINFWWSIHWTVCKLIQVFSTFNGDWEHGWLFCSRFCTCQDNLLVCPRLLIWFTYHSSFEFFNTTTIIAAFSLSCFFRFIFFIIQTFHHLFIIPSQTCLFQSPSFYLHYCFLFTVCSRSCFPYFPRRCCNP